MGSQGEGKEGKEEGERGQREEEGSGSGAPSTDFLLSFLMAP
jgi:hypothetical protein